jgi:hypothetical protein
MALRKAARVAAGVIWTKEQEKRDGWPRAWKWLEPKFADCDPRTIEPEHFLGLDPVTSAAKGLVSEVDRRLDHRTPHGDQGLARAVEEDGGDEILCPRCRPVEILCQHAAGIARPDLAALGSAAPRADRLAS